MANRLKVHADLVGATGIEHHREQRRRFQVLEHLEVRDRGARSLAIDRHPGAVARISTDGCVDGSRARRGNARHERSVLAANLAVDDGLLQAAERLIGAREHEEAAGVAVQAMHNAGALGWAARGLPGQQLHQRGAAVPGCRVHHHAGGLVDDQDCVIPIERRHALHMLLDGRRAVRWHCNGDLLARVHDDARFRDDGTVDGHLLLGDQALGLRA